MKKSVILKWWSMAAGSMDALTGLLLILAPLAVLRLLGIASPPDDALAFLSWIGVFVLAVGLAYGFALRGKEHGEAVWRFTALVRGLVAVFLTVKVKSGVMEPAWLLVAASDAAVAIAQGWMLQAGWWKEAGA